MARKNPTLGMDPEFFVSTFTGEVVPICDKVGGDKGNPIPFNSVPGLGDYIGSFLEDGVALEVNIQPVSTASAFNSYTMHLKEAIDHLLSSKRLLPVWGFSTYKFSNAQLNNPKAQTLGCDPDICAYGSVNQDGEWSPSARPKMRVEDLGNFRHVGGHIHFGYDTDLIPRHVMVQLIDALVYLPVLKYDKQTERRKIYGLAGLYREKDYGVEYRSMSNFWFHNQNRIAHNSIDYIIAINAINLMANLHRNQELMAELYSRLPILDVKNVIDEGVSGKIQETRWMELLHTIRKIPEMDMFDYRMAKGEAI